MVVNADIAILNQTDIFQFEYLLQLYFYHF